MEAVGPETDPASVTKRQIQDLCDEFLEAGYEPSTVTNTRNHLLVFFKYLEVTPNPAGDIKIPKQDRSDIRPWSEGERDRIREAADAIDGEPDQCGPSRRILVEHLFALGTRIQETAAGR